MRQTDRIKHEINTGDAAPIKSKCRPIPYALKSKVKDLLQSYLDQGLIENSSSPWASPIVLVKKKDGSIRLCIDYRKLNSVTKKDSYPLPNIEQTILTLQNKKIFSTLD